MGNIVAVKEIIKRRVYDVDGNDCGVITSLLLDPEDAQILFIVIKLDNQLLKLNGEVTAVPWNSIQFNPNTKDANLKINKDILSKAPKLNLSDLKLSNRNIFFDLLKYYGLQPHKNKNTNNPPLSDPLDSFHYKTEGEEYTSTSDDDKNKNNMGDELDFDKIKGLDNRKN